MAISTAHMTLIAATTRTSRRERAEAEPENPCAEERENDPDGLHDQRVADAEKRSDWFGGNEHQHAAQAVDGPLTSSARARLRPVGGETAVGRSMLDASFFLWPDASPRSVLRQSRLYGDALTVSPGPLPHPRKTVPDAANPGEKGKNYREEDSLRASRSLATSLAAAFCQL